MEVKNADLPQEIPRAIARQAGAERERRAKGIHAEGEFGASQRLTDATDVIGRTPLLATALSPDARRNRDGNNSTTIFPLSIHTSAPFLKWLVQK